MTISNIIIFWGGMIAIIGLVMYQIDEFTNRGRDELDEQAKVHFAELEREFEESQRKRREARILVAKLYADYSLNEFSGNEKEADVIKRAIICDLFRTEKFDDYTLDALYKLFHKIQ